VHHLTVAQAKSFALAMHFYELVKLLVPANINTAGMAYKGLHPKAHNCILLLFWNIVGKNFIKSKL